MTATPPPPGPPGPPPPPGGAFNAPMPGGGGVPVQNNLTIAIIGTVLGFFCCSLFGAVPGIIGIVFASQVNGLAMAGNMAAAEQKAKSAKTLGLVSIGLAVAGLVLGIIYFIVIIAAGSSSSSN